MIRQANPTIPWFYLRSRFSHNSFCAILVFSTKSFPLTANLWTCSSLFYNIYFKVYTQLYFLIQFSMDFKKFNKLYRRSYFPVHPSTILICWQTVSLLDHWVWSQERKGVLLWESTNIEYFIIQWLKPVLICSNPQNTRNYDAIQTINPPIIRIVLQLDCWSPHLILLLNSKNRSPYFQAA